MGNGNIGVCLLAPFSLKPLLIFFSRVGLTDDVQALEFLECQDMLPNLALLVLDIVLASIRILNCFSIEESFAWMFSMQRSLGGASDNGRFPVAVIWVETCLASLIRGDAAALALGLPMVLGGTGVLVLADSQAVWVREASLEEDTRQGVGSSGLGPFGFGSAILNDGFNGDEYRDLLEILWVSRGMPQPMNGAYIVWHHF